MEEQRPAWYEVPAQGAATPPTSPLERLRDRPVAAVGLAVAATAIVVLAGTFFAASQIKYERVAEAPQASAPPHADPSELPLPSKRATV